MHQKLSPANPEARLVPWMDRWDAAATALIAAQLGLVAWLVVPGGLYIDDVRAQAYAVDRPIWPFIIESNRTHLSPGARTVDWIQATYWPLEHWPAVLITLLTSALLGIALWRLLRQLVPRPQFALLGLVLGLYSASIVPALAWFRQTLTTLVALVAILVALDAAIRFFRGGSWGWAALAVLAHPIGLSFSERTLVLPVVVAAAGLLFPTPRRLRQRLARTVAVVIPMIVVNLTFLWFYGSGDYDKASQASPSLTGFLLSTSRSFFVNTVPSLLGGPLLWRPAEPSYAYASTPVAMVVLGGVVLLGLALRVWRSPRASRSAALRVAGIALAYIGPLYVMLYVGRVSRADITSVDDLRLYPDVGILSAVVVASLACAASRPVVASPRRRLLRRFLVVAPVVMAVALSLVSWSGFAARWHTSPTTEYLNALRADLRLRGEVVVPSPVPADVIPGWVQPDFLTSSLVRLLDDKSEVSLADGPQLIADQRGRLQPAHLRTVATAPRISSDFCGGRTLPAGTDSLRVPFREPVPYYRGSHLRIRTLVADTTTLQLSVIGDDGSETRAVSPSQPRLQRGPHVVLVPVPYGVRVNAVVVRRSADVAVCVPGLAVVLPEVKT